MYVSLRCLAGCGVPDSSPTPGKGGRAPSSEESLRLNKRADQNCAFGVSIRGPAAPTPPITCRGSLVPPRRHSPEPPACPHLPPPGPCLRRPLRPGSAGSKGPSRLRGFRRAVRPPLVFPQPPAHLLSPAPPPAGCRSPLGGQPLPTVPACPPPPALTAPRTLSIALSPGQTASSLGQRPGVPSEGPVRSKEAARPGGRGALRVCVLGSPGAGPKERTDRESEQERRERRGGRPPRDSTPVFLPSSTSHKHRPYARPPAGQVWAEGAPAPPRAGDQGFEPRPRTRASRAFPRAELHTTQGRGRVKSVGTEDPEERSQAFPEKL